MARANISLARRAAFAILSRVEKEKAFTSILLPLYEEELKAEDRAFCHELVLGVIRQRTFLDRIVEHFSQKKISKLDLPVVLALRMGLYQMRFMTRVPSHAALNESVELVKAAKVVSAAGFVNAVLRRAQKEPDFDPSAGITDEFEGVSVRTSHPRWLLEKWAAQFGFDEAEKLARANNQIPATSFRVNRAADNSVLDELAKTGVEFSSSQLAPGCFIALRAGRPLYEFAEQGKIVLQDEASQVVAGLVKLEEGESFLDVCAAPGNKTTQIINEARARNVASDKVLYAAGDIYPQRLETLRRTLAKARIENVKVCEYDATESMPFETERFDWILLDAPCSGTGTIRHNPEIRWSIGADNFAELAAKQTRILANAAKILKTGGRLVYSTCSLEPEENEQVVEEFLRANKNFLVVKPDVASELVTERNFVRTFPQRDKTDGFFAAVLRKN
jgi:16S rRNA (cytosine967-C5)-methyltransferase